MTEAKHSSESPQSVSEMQEESELSALSEELRMVMANDARSVVPKQIPRRAFLNRIAQVSLPAGMILATGGVAHACWMCDENSGCRAGCLFCKEGSGCQAECLLYQIEPPCTTFSKIPPCGADYVCTMEVPPMRSSGSGESKSDVIQQLEF